MHFLQIFNIFRQNFGGQDVKVFTVFIYVECACLALEMVVSCLMFIFFPGEIISRLPLNYLSWKPFKGAIKM